MTAEQTTDEPNAGSIHRNSAHYTFNPPVLSKPLQSVSATAVDSHSQTATPPTDSSAEKPQPKKKPVNSGLVVTDLLKLRIALDQTTSPENACQVLAENIANFFDCPNVFVSAFDSRKKLRVLGRETASNNEKYSRDNILSAQREVNSDEKIKGWPENQHWSPSRVHQSLISESAPFSMSVWMEGPNQSPFGVVTLVGNRTQCLTASQKLSHISDLVVPHIQLQQSVARTSLEKCRDAVFANFNTRVKWAIVVMLAFVFFFIRIPNRMECDLEVKPVVRRFVAAPFDGVLKTSLVRAGDFVSKEDPLAKLDEDDLLLQQSSVEAEKEKFRKQKSAALAKGETLAMQQAQLEYKRMSFKNDMLNRRSENLDITSPISGVVLKNELEDAEGAPLKQGQVLFEIAPLDKIVFNIYISQQDVAYVDVGMQVLVRLEAAQQSFKGTICKIRPQATTFEDESVFVAELEFDNKQGLIRPGMRGYATIIGEQQSVGWILFRKPFGYLKRLTGF